MPITMHPEGERTVRLELTGVLRKPDLARCESDLANQLARSGSLKVLCVLTGFEGWDPELDSHNLAFT